MLSKDTHGTVVRIAPPLVIAREDLAWAVGEIRAAWASSNATKKLRLGDGTRARLQGKWRQDMEMMQAITGRRVGACTALTPAGGP